MLRPSKIAYYYDEKSCTWEQARFTRKWFIETFLTYGIFSIVAVIAFTGFYRNHFSTSKEAVLRQEHQELVSSITELNGEIGTFESAVNELFSRQNELYAPIVGSSRISPTVWEVGAGGTSLFGKTDIAARTQVRLGKLGHRIKLLQSSLKDAQFKALLKTEYLANLPSILPVTGKLISGFGYRVHPIHGGENMHTGLDFACRIGTAVYASGDGVVLTAGSPESGYGLQVDINHENTYVTKYAHLSQTMVHPGEKVKRGQIIGYSGNTGMSTGPHLHYEIIHNGTKIDPIDYFYSDLSPTSYLKKKLNAPAMDLHQEGQGN